MLYWTNLIVWWWSTATLFFFEPDPNAHVVGYILVSLGICILVYQMYMFWRRQNLIMTKRVDYTDAVGINVIILTIVFGLGFSGFYAAQTNINRSNVFIGTF